MPNWVINNVTAKGTKKALNSFIETVKTEETDFDFNKIKPMPESLNITSGGKETESIVYYVSERLTKDVSELARDPVINAKVDYILLSLYGSIEAWIENNIERIKKMPGEELDDLYQLGQQYVDNIVKYGSSSWYDWCCENWGTKWNASDAYIGDPRKAEKGFKLDFSFDTAWSMPLPIFKAMVEKFPDIKFSGEFADEDIGSNCGMWEQKGKKIYLKWPEDSVAFACRIWGYDPSEFEDEDEDGEDVEFECVSENDMQIETIVIPADVN